MTPAFGAPWGLLALAAVPALVALYFLRRRGEPRRVSALFLWRSTEDVAEAGPHLSRLDRRVSLALELVAVLAATAFLSDVRCSGQAPRGTHAIVVLDGGLSMRARGDDGEPLTLRARREAISWLSSAGAATVIETGPRPHVLAGPSASVSDAADAIQRWEPSQPSHDLGATWALVREIAGAEGTVLFVTDSPDVEGLPAGTGLVALGAPRDNTALVSAMRVDSDDATVLRLRLARFADTPAKTTLDVFDERGERVHRADVELSPGTAHAIDLTLAPSGALRVVLPADALPDDGDAWLLPEPKARVRVASDLPATIPAAAGVERFLQAASGVERGEPADLRIRPSDARVSPEWTLSIGATGDELRTFVGPFFADRHHPMLEDLSFEGVVWTAGPNPPGRPLLSAGDRVLISEADDHRFHLNVDLSRSNLHRTLAWPLLLANLVDLRRQSLTGFARHNIHAGEATPVHVPATGDTRLVGAGVDRALLPGSQSLTGLAPGRYELRLGGETVDRLSVLAIDAGESDLRTRGSGRVEPTSTGTTVVGTGGRALWPVLLMLAALLADFAWAAPGVRRRFGREAA